MYSSSATAPSASKKQVKIALRHFVNNSYLLTGPGSHERLKGRLREGREVYLEPGPGRWDMGTWRRGQGRTGEMETLKHVSSSCCCFTPPARTREATDPAGVGLRAAGSDPPRRANRDVYCLHKQLDLAQQILGEGAG